MSHRTVASIMASFLLAVLFVVAVWLPVPFVVMSPGPTVDVLAENHGKEIVHVSGHPRYPTKGRLELVTIELTGPKQKVNLGEALTAWFDKSRALYPRAAFYAPGESEQDVNTQSSVQMVSSQDTAVAVALKELGYHPHKITEVLAVTPGSPADGKLKTRDHILSVNGEQIRHATDVSRIVRRTPKGQQATFVVRRGGQERTDKVVPEPSKQNPKIPLVGIVVGPSYQLPFNVSVDIPERIGGPSAGLMFSLSVYDTLTPGALTGGAPIAGTGTISDNGRVGPIGGIQQKIVAAADSGAKLFFVPPGNCASAMASGISSKEMRLVKAPTMHSAVESLHTYAANHNAALPSCAG